MTNTQTLKLIEGQFQHEEAKEMLLNLYAAKINFHQMKNFGSQERYGKDDAIAQDRIPKLKNEINHLAEILAEAQATNQQLIIHSEIHISFFKEE
jgi:hypothetical protein